MNIVFIGMPGSGKDTQAQKLAAKLNLPFVATGNIFRYHIEKQTEVGKIVESALAGGNLAPDDITFSLLKEGLNGSDISRGVIIDGYPRNISQAKLLDSYMQIDKVINIDLSDSDVIERISGRRTCACGVIYHIKFNPPKNDGICDVCGKELFVRDDEKEESIKTRIEIYKKNVDPLLDFYRKKGIVVDIDGSLAIDEVTNEINTKLGI